MPPGVTHSSVLGKDGYLDTREAAWSGGGGRGGRRCSDGGVQSITGQTQTLWANSSH